MILYSPVSSDAALPGRPYTKDQIKAYLMNCREKCPALIPGLTDERGQQRCDFEWMEPSFLDLQQYSMRHVPEQAAQLSFVLGQYNVTGFDWIATARDQEA